MPNIVAFRDFFNYTIDSQSTQDSNWPASNIKLPEKQFRVWKTTAATDSWVILDFGAAKVINAVVLVNINFITYKIQGNATNSFVSPSFDSGNITVSKDPFRERYYSIKNPQSFASFNYRYMRIFIPTQTPVDGASVFSVGGIVVSDQSAVLLRNPNFGFQIAVKRASDVIGMLSGANEIVNRGERYLEFAFDIDPDRSSSHLDQIANLLLTIDQSASLMFAMNGNMLEKADNSQFVYLLKRAGEPEYQVNEHLVADVRGLNFREQI